MHGQCQDVSCFFFPFFFGGGGGARCSDVAPVLKNVAQWGRGWVGVVTWTLFFSSSKKLSQFSIYMHWVVVSSQNYWPLCNAREETKKEKSISELSWGLQKGHPPISEDNMEYLQHDMNCLWTINFMFILW